MKREKIINMILGKMKCNKCVDVLLLLLTQAVHATQV